MPRSRSDAKANSASVSRPTSTSSLPRITVAGSPPLATNRKRGSSRPLALDGEVPLVRLHRGDHDAVGQLQEALVDPAGEHRRPLGQVDDLVELSQRVDPLARPRSGRPRSARGARVASTITWPPRMSLAIAGRRADLDLAAEEPVAARDARRDEAEQLDRHDPLVDLDDEPAHRPREAAVSQRIDFEKLIAATNPATSSGTSSSTGAAAPSEIDPHQAVALDQVVGVEAVLAGKPGAGLLRRVGLRAADLLALRGPLGGQPGRDRGDPARAHVHPDGIRGQPEPVEAVGEQARAPGARPRGRRRRADPRSRSRSGGQAPCSSTSRYIAATAWDSRRIRST